MEKSKTSSPTFPNDFPLFWIIEALADIKDIDTNMLEGLMRNVSDHKSEVGELVKEKIALRHLEDLFGVPESNHIALNLDQIPKFDASKLRAQDVVRRIFNKTVVDFSKQDVLEFILQKRASFRKCSLQQLKEEIVQGRFPSLTERSGLNVDRNAVATGRLFQSTDNVEGENASNGAAKQTEVLSLDGKRKRFDDARSFGHSTSSEPHRMNETATLVTHPNDNEAVQEEPDVIVISSPRKSSSCSKEGQASLDGREQRSDVKKSQPDYTEPKSMGQNVNEAMREDPPDVVGISSPMMSSPCTKEQQAGCFNGHEQHPDVKKPKYSELKSTGQTVNEAMQEDLPDVIVISSPPISSSCTKEQQAGCFDGCEQRSDVKKPEHSKCKSNGLNIDPSVATEPIEAPLDDLYLSISDEERISAAEKSKKYSKTSDWTKTRSCVKCCQGGQLLICCVSNCSIIVHESCLCSSASFDDTGNFYCPYCSLSLANAEWEEATEKLSQAKKKESSACDDYLRFLRMINMRQQKQPSEILPVEKSSQSRMGVKANVINETEHHQEAEVAAGCSNVLNRAPSASFGERNDAGLTNGGSQRNQTNSDHDGKMVENEVLEAVPLSKRKSFEQDETIMRRGRRKQNSPPQCDAGNSPRLDLEAVVGSKNADLQQQSVISPKGPSSLEHQVIDLTEELASPLKVNARETSPNLPPLDTVLNSVLRVDERKRKAVLQQRAETSPQTPKTPFVDTMLNSERRVDEGKRKAVLQQRAGKSPETPNAAYVDAMLNGERGVDERKRKGVLQQGACKSPQTPLDVSSVLKRRKLPSPQVPGGFPSSSRRKILWSSEEEKTLKEGVKKFYNSDQKNIPWKKILRYGHHVFLQCRKAQDLKDKYRRLTGEVQKQADGSS